MACRLDLLTVHAQRNHRCELYASRRPSRLPTLATGTMQEHKRSNDGQGKQKDIVVLAFGGNSLLQRGEDLTMENQRKNAAHAAQQLSEFQGRHPEYQLCITHGNGPQVGLLAQGDTKSGLDVLDAETEGQIGYILETEIANALQNNKEVVTHLTQVVVDRRDEAFQNPTKHIGKWMTEDQAKTAARENGWAIARDGKQWRRVVPSPEPKEIIELRAIEILLKENINVICCGGGGIPVAVDNNASYRRYGIECVIDKDAVSGLLAAKLGAKWFIMVTDAGAVYDPKKWPDEKVPIESPMHQSQLSAEDFEAGSMSPKIKAALKFINQTGGKVGIGRISDLEHIMAGRAGTLILP